MNERNALREEGMRPAFGRGFHFGVAFDLLEMLVGYLRGENLNSILVVLGSILRV